MKKTTVENAIKNLPSLVSNIAGYIKDTLSFQKQKNTITNASGSIGFLINFFGKPFLEKYFNKVSSNRLKDFGFLTYAKAAFKQATNSLETLETDSLMPTLDIPALLVEKFFFDSIDKYDKSFNLLIFQPKFHPAISMVKKSIVDMLTLLNINENEIKKFKKNFNDNIETAVEDEFGDDYQKHKQKVKKVWFQENETQLLIDLVEQSKIGFVEDENLRYEEAYGSWMPVSQRTYGEDHEIEEIEEMEANLSKVEDSIEEYFQVNPENHIEKVLFLIADFGKGKSVFLKQYAAKLAWNYIETGEGYFPIYFNLRNYAQYNGETQLGVIEDFLQTKYAIKIDSDYFKTKKYIFLVDSLDESGDLSNESIGKVINSIKRIQNLDKTIYRANRIVITSRPFDEFLFNIIINNKPYIIKKEGKNIPHYISLYGFKKEQFNEWISFTLKSIIAQIDITKDKSFINELLRGIKKERTIDIYALMLKNQTLKSSELRRPIFAYMIYRLIKNDINITSVGKIGIYLSFLNLLSKEAKYIHDPNFKINVQEQFEARSILHHIAALWTYERQQGKQGFLKKPDICRLISGFGNNLSDQEVLEEFKNNGGSDIQFLSHSYFGENDNIMHFQHQSFAEILMAEYYLKVLIKYALDRTPNLDFVISKLKVGVPTLQTIEFFREILALLRDSSLKSNHETLEKRKLLIPLLASISINTNNRTLYSDLLYYQWYEKAQINRHTTDIPETLSKNWCITEEVLNKMASLCEQIILSEKIYLLSRSDTITSLIDKEVTYISNSNYEATLSLEKQLALITGNAVFNNKKRFFLRKFDARINIDLVSNNSKEWMTKEFIGLTINEDHRNLVVKKNLVLFDLSNAIFNNVTFTKCNFSRCDFSKTKFRNVIFRDCYIFNCNFETASLEGYIDISSTIFNRSFKLPTILSSTVRKNSRKISNIFKHFYYSSDGLFNIVLKPKNQRILDRIFETFTFYFKFCLKNKILTTKDIYSAFETGNEKLNEMLNGKVLKL